jgi:hypothetical protein
MIKNLSRKLWIAVFMMGMLVPCIQAQSTGTSSSTPTPTTDVVSGTDPEPISPHLIDVLMILIGLL